MSFMPSQYYSGPPAGRGQRPGLKTWALEPIRKRAHSEQTPVSTMEEDLPLRKTSTPGTPLPSTIPRTRTCRPGPCPPMSVLHHRAVSFSTHPLQREFRFRIGQWPRTSAFRWIGKQRIAACAPRCNCVESSNHRSAPARHQPAPTSVFCTESKLYPDRSPICAAGGRQSYNTHCTLDFHLFFFAVLRDTCPVLVLTWSLP